jgi:sulfatase modifying factor 1
VGRAPLCPFGCRDGSPRARWLSLRAGLPLATLLAAALGAGPPQQGRLILAPSGGHVTVCPAMLWRKLWPAVFIAAAFVQSAFAGPNARSGAERAASPPPSATPGSPPALVRGCPAEMARVQSYCIDRWEVSLVDRKTRAALSPFYPPQWRLLRRVREVWKLERHNFGDEAARSMPLPELPPVQTRGAFEPMAVSRPGLVPQGYLSYHLARSACHNAGKRLCSEEEWTTACRGARQTIFPYGSQYQPLRCNVHRELHPAYVLHGDSSFGHTDPRLNLVVENGFDPLLRLTGGTPGCASRWGEDAIYDLVGNLDEWIEDESGVFLGGFYSRMTTRGCEAKIASHVPAYYDYSLGTRCCTDARE